MNKIHKFLLGTMIVASSFAPKLAFGQQNTNTDNKQKIEQTINNNLLQIVNGPETAEFNIAYENNGKYKYKKETHTIPWQKIIVKAHNNALEKTALKRVANIRDVTDSISDVVPIDYLGTPIKYFMYDVVVVQTVAKGVQIKTIGQGVVAMLADGSSADFGGTNYRKFQDEFPNTVVRINGMDNKIPNLPVSILRDKPNADKQLAELLTMKANILEFENKNSEDLKTIADKNKIESEYKELEGKITEATNAILPVLISDSKIEQSWINAADYMDSLTFEQKIKFFDSLIQTKDLPLELQAKKVSDVLHSVLMNNVQQMQQIKNNSR